MSSGGLTSVEKVQTDGFDPGRSRNLDVLRLIAVLLVVQCHLFIFWGDPTFYGFIKPNWLGRYGVTLFFVHTALVLMASMDRQWSKTGRRHFYSIFFVRRAFRIFPLATAALFIVVLLNIPGEITRHSIYHINGSRTMLLANFLLVQNFVTGGSILGPLWSLPFEWQMYISLPFFYFLVRRIDNVLALFFIWSIPILIAISYSTRINRFNSSHPVWKIPDWHYYAPCFIAGILAYFVAVKMKPRPIFPPITIPALVAIIGIPMMSNNGFHKFAPATLMVGLAIPYCREIRFGWFSEMARIVVRYSYGIYVLHMIGIYLAFMKLTKQSHLVQWMVFAAFVIVVPVAFYHLLEHPAIQFGNRIAKWLEQRPTPANRVERRTAEITPGL